MLATKGFSTEDRSESASGGNNTYDYTHGGVEYKVHKFTADGTFTVALPIPFDILVIAGGGSGGGAGARGAGGAGGLRWLTDQHLVSGDYICTIGAGGGDPPGSDTEGNNGSPSSFIRTVGHAINISASGGGAGGGGGSGAQQNGNDGGSGGGSNFQGTGGSGDVGNYTPDEGTNGGGSSAQANYGGGGGGGAGGAGGTGTTSAGGTAGVGASTFVNSSAAETTAFLSGASAGELVSGVRYIAGGGGGGIHVNQAGAAGGHGGGGNGGGNAAGTNGTANTGGGGGGGGNTHKGGQGGSGIILIRYRLHFSRTIHFRCRNPSRHYNFCYSFSRLKWFNNNLKCGYCSWNTNWSCN